MAINLSSTTPAAPAGDQLVAFQTDGSGNVSAYIPATSSLLTPNSVDLTGQGANIGVTTIVAVPNNGVYRVSAYIIVTTVDLTSSTLPSVVIKWTDQNNGQAQTLTLTPTNAGNTQTTYQEATAVLSVSTSAAIQYSTTGYASNVGGTMKYAVHIRVEAM